MHDPKLPASDDREAHRAAVEAGYASLAGYVEKWGDDTPRQCGHGLVGDCPDCNAQGFV